MLTGATNLGVKRLGIVFVEDVGGNVGGMMENHCCFGRLRVGGEEEEDRGPVGRGLRR